MSSLATWITPKKLASKPFLITFNRCTPPQSMKIPGVVDNLRIYDYKEKPLFCTNCMEYTYSKRKCKKKYPMHVVFRTAPKQSLQRKMTKVFSL